MQQQRISWQFANRVALLALVLFLGARFRPPIDWAESQFLFSYDFGFQRRALFGEILTWFLPDTYSGDLLHAIGFSMSIAMLIALYAFVAKRFQEHEAGTYLIITFATSVGVTNLIANTGYLDTILVIMAVACLALPITLFGMLLRCVFLGVGVLVHENMLPYFSVLIAVDVWLRSSAQDTASRLIWPSALMIFATGLAWVVIAFGSHPYEIWDAFYEALRERAPDNRLGPFALEPVFEFPPEEAYSLVVWGTDYYDFRLKWFGGLGLLLLGLTFYPIFIALGHRSALDRLGVILALLAPLSLLFIAFDVSRFFSVSFVNLFLVTAVLLRTDQQFADQLKKTFTLPHFLFLLVVSCHVMLNDLSGDYERIKGFPISLYFLEEWFYHGEFPIPQS